MTTGQLVKLDGRTLEGGGQLLRNALCLSALTGIPVEIENIRGNRSSGGGLKAQHLACVKWLALACNATVTGDEKGSKTILFVPGIQDRHFSPAYSKRNGDAGADSFESVIDIGSAGSTGLVLQAILPYVFFVPPQRANTSSHIRLRVSGGTNVSGSPSYEYVTQVLLPTLEAIGLPSVAATLEKRGWSTGKSTPGLFTLELSNSQATALSAFEMCPFVKERKPAKPKQLGITFLGPRSCQEHLKTVLIPAVQHYFGGIYTEAAGNLSITCEDSGDERRLYLIIVATVSTPPGSRIAEYRLARDWLYERKVRSVERAVTEMSERVAANIYHEWSGGGWVDEHMRDQLIIFQALSRSRSSVWAGLDQDGEKREPSLHARTAQWVVEAMLGVHFGADDTCDGIGFARSCQDELVHRLASTSMNIQQI